MPTNNLTTCECCFKKTPIIPEDEFKADYLKFSNTIECFPFNVEKHQDEVMFFLKSAVIEYLEKNNGINAVHYTLIKRADESTYIVYSCMNSSYSNDFIKSFKKKDRNTYQSIQKHIKKYNNNIVLFINESEDPGFYNLNLKSSNFLISIKQYYEKTRSPLTDKMKAAYCGFCGKLILVTSRKSCPCRNIYYCGRECQRGDWKVHKKTCPHRFWNR